MSYEIIDILSDEKLLRMVTQKAAKLHPENFQYFENRIPGYTHFFIVKLHGEIVAMSGIWRCDKWPDNYYRVADRSFYFPNIREVNISSSYKKQGKAICSHILIPLQTRIVLDLNGLPFYSMLNHPNALRKSVERLNKVSEHKYKVLDGLYWTCPEEVNYNHKSCWQNVAVLENIDQWDLPKYE